MFSAFATKNDAYVAASPTHTYATSLFKLEEASNFFGWKPARLYKCYPLSCCGILDLLILQTSFHTLPLHAFRTPSSKVFLKSGAPVLTNSFTLFFKSYNCLVFIQLPNLPSCDPSLSYNIFSFIFVKIVFVDIFILLVV